MRKLLVATHNQGKVSEYRELLGDLPLFLTSLDDQGITDVVEETGETFVENASLKAQAYAQMSMLWTWADDSGLVVDILDGRPGVFSARYGGPQASDRDRYEKLLDDLRPYPKAKWAARFQCVVAIALPDGQIFTAEGRVEGMITDRPRGQYGFGYDPIFYLPELGVTMAELAPDVKNRISHRGKAALGAKQLLFTLIEKNDNSR